MVVHVANMHDWEAVMFLSQKKTKQKKQNQLTKICAYFQSSVCVCVCVCARMLMRESQLYL